MKHSRVLLVTTCDKLEIFLEFDISYQKMSEMEGSLDSRLPTLVVRKPNEQSSGNESQQRTPGALQKVIKETLEHSSTKK